MYKINTTRPTTSVFIPLWANWWHIIIILCSTSNDLYCNYSVSLLNECVSSFVTMCCYCCLSCFFFFVFFHIMSYNTLFYIGRCVTNIFNEPLIQQFYFFVWWWFMFLSHMRLLRKIEHLYAHDCKKYFSSLNTIYFTLD